MCHFWIFFKSYFCYRVTVQIAEVSQRIQTAHPGGRQVMLHYLLPWMNNVELVEFKPTTRRPEDCGSGEEEEDGQEQEIMMVNSRRWLRGEGWGSPRATTMVLNNLMFMTAKVRRLLGFPSPAPLLRIRRAENPNRCLFFAVRR